MAVWNVAPVKDEPELVLDDWRVFELRGIYGDEVSRHFVGTRRDERSGRVSSGIRTFDAKRRRGTTSTGRVYHLSGRPGWSMNSEYVWASFCSIHSVRDVRDVTEELMEQMERAKGHAPNRRR